MQMNQFSLIRNSGQPLELEFEDSDRRVATIKVVGVGGAGGNAINRMVDDRMSGVDFITVNTDLQALDQNRAPCCIQIGKNLTRGLGAGGNPEIGKKAIEENKDAVIEVLSETDMVFITCGMGGGTGTGAAPVLGEIAKDLGALTVGIVTKPFYFEGTQRSKKAEKGIRELRQNVDTLIEIPNQKLLSLVSKNTPLEDAFKKADEILLHATKGISDVINVPGLINVDFADVRTVMTQSGEALMCSAVCSGDNRAHDAAEQAIHSPLIDEVSIAGAKNVLVNITGGKDFGLNDIHEAATVIQEGAGSDGNIIVGAVIDPTMEGQLRVTVIATGFHRESIHRNILTEKSDKKVKPLFEDHFEGQPLMDRMETEQLEQTMSEIFGHDDGYTPFSKNDINYPAYLRRQIEEKV